MGANWATATRLASSPRKRGPSGVRQTTLDSRFRGNDDMGFGNDDMVCAGMTILR